MKVYDVSQLDLLLSFLTLQKNYIKNQCQLYDISLVKNCSGLAVHLILFRKVCVNI